jgi:hypothetical protein
LTICPQISAGPPKDGAAAAAKYIISITKHLQNTKFQASARKKHAIKTAILHSDQTNEIRRGG